MQVFRGKCENTFTKFGKVRDNRTEKLICQEKENSLQKATSPGAAETFAKPFQENQLSKHASTGHLQDQLEKETLIHWNLH